MTVFFEIMNGETACEERERERERERDRDRDRDRDRERRVGKKWISCDYLGGGEVCFRGSSKLFEGFSISFSGERCESDRCGKERDLARFFFCFFLLFFSLFYSFFWSG